jgi:AraC-like DNA-binding protein
VANELPDNKKWKGNVMNGNDTLIETLINSKTYQDYERAYSEATGMPVALRPVETWQLPLHGKRRESPFCALVGSCSSSCAACLQTQEKLCQKSHDRAEKITCEYGLCEAAVPVRLGNETIGYLQTGQVMLQKPTETQFSRVLQQLAVYGIKADAQKVRAAYMATPVVSSKKFQSITYLLSTFAEHLSAKGNQIAMQRSSAEPPAITKARQYIEENFAEDISLGMVASAVHTSTFYFCKLFKRSTGVNFTEYVSRVRTEKAKNLLLNHNLRISEIAYAVGFQSLTHFNRIFKKITGQSPSEYRATLPKAI